MHTEIPWDAPEEIVTKTVLSPSVRNDGSVLDVDFHGKTVKGASTKRNELTVLRYVYDDGTGDFTIYILVNDNWEVIHGMEID